jgi:hypothetical protein
MIEPPPADLTTDVPEADLLEQRAAVGEEDPSGDEALNAFDRVTVLDAMADEGDLLEQAALVGDDDEDDHAR